MGEVIRFAVSLAASFVGLYLFLVLVLSL